MEHGASCTCDVCMDKDEHLYTVWHKDDEDEDADTCGRCGGPGPLNQQGMCWHCQ